MSKGVNGSEYESESLAELRQLVFDEHQAVIEMDKEHAEEGFTHRVTWWKHGRGDDTQHDVYLAVEPEPYFNQMNMFAEQGTNPLGMNVVRQAMKETHDEVKRVLCKVYIESLGRDYQIVPIWELTE